MKLISNKKGIFFTFLAIIMMGGFILLFTPQNDVAIQRQTDSVEQRINAVNEFVLDIENNYYPAILRASTYRTMLSLSYYMNQSGSYIRNFDKNFSEVMIKGTLNKVPIDSITGKQIMENNTLLNWTRKIEQIGWDTLRVNTSINVTSVSISQSTPWEVTVVATINFSAKSEVASWSVNTTTIITTMSIEGWQDPAYLVETGGRYSNSIKRSKVEFNQWNVSQLKDHITNGTYAHWPFSSAPNYLTRFTGVWMNSNSSCCGIHSVLRPGNLTTADMRRSYVDYMFWNNSFTSFPADCARIYNLTQPNGQGPYTGGIWDQFKFFKLDLGHLNKYNITSEHYKVGGC